MFLGLVVVRSMVENVENQYFIDAQSKILSNPSHASATIEISPINKLTPSIHQGMVDSCKTATRYVDGLSKSLRQLKSDKNSENNQLLYKSNYPNSHADFGFSDNLVINFSDDDSGSEYEEYAQEQQALQTKRNAVGIDGIRKLPAHSSAQSCMRQQEATNIKKVLPKKLPSDTIFASSIAGRYNRGSVNRGGDPLSANRGYNNSCRKFKPLSRNVVQRDQSMDRQVNLNNNKLRDLRQQIVLRERELRLRAAQQIRESVLDSRRDDDDATTSREEVDRKRLKVNHLHSIQHAESLAKRSGVPSPALAPDGDKLEDKNVIARSQKGKSTAGREAGMSDWDDKGPNINSKCNFHDGSVQVDPCALLAQNTHLTDTSSNVLRNTIVHVNQPRKDGAPQLLSSCLVPSPTEDVLVGCCKENESTSQDNILDPSLNNISQVSIDSMSQNEFCENILECCRKNMLSLIEIEESLDKELEEAQDVRHKCEIEERNALKTFRKAQRALIEANDRCTKLYHRREFHAAHFRSFVTNDSYSFNSLKYFEDAGVEVRPTNSTAGNLHLMPTSSYQMQLNCDGIDQPGDPCTAPDDGAPGGLVHNDEIAADDNIPQLDGDTMKVDSNRQKGGQSFVEMKEMDSDLQQNSSVVASQNSLDLEATLRSKLFARLSARTLSKNNCLNNLVKVDEEGITNGIGSRRTHSSNDGSEQHQNYCFEGHPTSKRNNASGAPDEIWSHEHSCCDPTGNSEGNRCLIGDQQSSFLISPPLVFLSALTNAKSLFPSQDDASDFGNKWKRCHNSDDIVCDDLLVCLEDRSVGTITVSEAGSFACDVAVDTFWPLCMFELRGKCNNNQCPWQHFCDFYHGEKYDTLKHAKFHDTLTLPIYPVCSEILKDDFHLYGSIIAQKNGKQWDKCYSLCLASSSLLDLDSAEDVIANCRIEIHGTWDRRISCFQNKNIVKYFNQPLPSREKSLEMALLVLCQEVNKLEGIQKALSLLSRAIEFDPSCEALWIIYLLIYHTNVKSVAKDDMFSYAVKHNGSSYGLWLMYINSRLHIGDRLTAYDDALSALCRRASRAQNSAYGSACILDIFLQMMDSFRMCGSMNKGLKRIYDFFQPESDPDKPRSLIVSDIISCLTISDQYIFWVCCVYLVVYEKLPNAIVGQFERDKQLLAIDWPPVCSPKARQQEAFRFLETVANHVDHEVSSRPDENAEGLATAQHFALSHVRCLVALGYLELSLELWNKCLCSWPNCLEFLLISARAQSQRDCGGFEGVLSGWPKEAPGVQCVWNQYIEHGLRAGGLDFAKKVIFRWLSCYGQLEFDDESTNPRFSSVDLMFAYLNLSLAKLMQNDRAGAREAIDRAAKAASPPYIRHFLREHALFHIYDSHFDDSPLGAQLTILRRYLTRSQPPRALSSEPFSRWFISGISNRSVCDLIGVVLCPISSSSALLLDDVVELFCTRICFLDMMSEQPGDAVGFVESFMQMVPHAYQLALSVCRCLRSSGKSKNASLLYWACSVLVDALFHALPVPPEYLWVEVAEIISEFSCFVSSMEMVSDRFYKKALSAYPFSVKLWDCCGCMQKKIHRDASLVAAAARRKGMGIELGLHGYCTNMRNNEPPC